MKLCIERHVPEKSDGKFGRLSLSQIFQQVSKPLTESKVGPKRTAQQCIVKYKKLKASYFAYKRGQGKSGAAREEPPPHFEELDQLFGTRPRGNFANEFGRDSSEGVDHAILSVEESSTGSGSEAHDTQETSSSSSSTSRLPPKVTAKYKSFGSKTNPVAASICSFAAECREEQKQQNQWLAENLRLERENQKEMANSLTQAFRNGIAAITNMFSRPVPVPFQSVSSAPQPPFVPTALPFMNPMTVNSPTHSAQSISNINMSPLPVHNQILPHISSAAGASACNLPTSPQTSLSESSAPNIDFSDVQVPSLSSAMKSSPARATVSTNPPTLTTPCSPQSIPTKRAATPSSSCSVPNVPGRLVQVNLLPNGKVVLRPSTKPNGGG